MTLFLFIPQTKNQRRTPANSRPAKNQKKQKKQQSQPRKQQKNLGRQLQNYQNIPSTLAVSIKNNKHINAGTVKISGKEIISTIIIQANDPVGTYRTVNLDPTNLFGTRLQGFSRSFELYRFTRCSFTPVSSAATSSPGTIVYAYSANPDLAFSRDSASNGIFALPGSCMSSVWAPQTIHCPLKNGTKNGWYVSDIDSKELLFTTQGQFMFVVIAPVTSTISFSIICDYDIEYSQPVSTPSGGTSIYVPSDISLSSFGKGAFSTVPPLNDINPNHVYVCEPDIQVPMFGSDSSTPPIMVRATRFIEEGDGIAAGLRFYTNVADALSASTPVDPSLGHPYDLKIQGGTTFIQIKS